MFSDGLIAGLPGGVDFLVVDPFGPNRLFGRAVLFDGIGGEDFVDQCGIEAEPDAGDAFACTCRRARDASGFAASG